MNWHFRLTTLLKTSALLISMLSIPAYSAHGSVTEHSFKFDPGDIKFLYDGNYVKIDVEDWDKTSEPGEPVIPCRIVKLLIPAGESIDSIDVSGSYNELPGTYLIV